MERGTVEWNSGMVERWNTGMVERAINDPVPFLLANWACTLAYVTGELSTSLQVERVF